MAKAKVRLNSSGMRSLLNSRGVRAHLTVRADRVLAAAQADPHDDTHAYEESLEIVQSSTDRVAVRVAATDPKAMLVEASFGVLSRALDAAGGERS